MFGSHELPSEMLPLADAIAERVVDRLHRQPSQSKLVDAATLAGVLGVSRAWVYENAQRLGARRLGEGPRGRLRFDLDAAQTAFACYTSKQSQGSNTSTGAKSLAPPGRRQRRLSNGLPEPGSVLAVRPRSGP
jgi:hypothetical protein